MSNRDVVILPFKKILIIRFSSLGDIVMTTAMIRSLRTAHPKAQIDMVVREDFFELIENNPHLNKKISLSRKSGFKGLWALAKRLRAEKYDLVYDAHISLRSLFLVPLLGAGKTVRFDKQYIRRNLSLTFKLPLLKGGKRFLERFCDPLKTYGVAYDGLGPELYLKAEDESFANAIAVTPGQKIIGLIPSAQWPGKRWRWENFRSLAIKLISETSDLIWVFGGPGDWFCDEIVRGLDPDRVKNFSGRLSIGKSAALLKRTQFVIANDTGMMHVADALGIPTVLLLGPTSGDLGCLPFHPQSKVVERNLWCRPCSKNGQAPCIRFKRVCLEGISVETVWQHVRRISQVLQHSQT